MRKLHFIAAISLTSLMLAASAPAFAPGGKGGGKPDKGDEPSGPFNPAFVFTESAKDPVVKLANRDFTSFRDIAVMGDLRTRGLEYDPNGGRVLVEEHRTLVEYEYAITAGGEVTLTGSSVWKVDTETPPVLQCVALSETGVGVYSLIDNSTGTYTFKVRQPDGTESEFTSERITSCDFYPDGNSFVAVIDESGSSAWKLLRIALDGTVLDTLITDDGSNYTVGEVDIAPDGQTYLLNWLDRRGSQNVYKVTEWQKGQSVLALAPMAVDADGGNYLCDWNNDGSPDGIIYRSDSNWYEKTGSVRRLTNARGNRGYYAMRAAC